MNQKLSTLKPWHILLAVPLLAASLSAAEPAPQELLRAAKKNMQDRTWKVSVLAQGDHPMKVAGIIHDQDFDLTVRTEVGESRQIVIGQKCWMTKDHGKTWKSYPTADRRFYYLTHAPITSTAKEKIPPFEKLDIRKEWHPLVHVRLINESPISFEGDRSNAWIVMKDGKADVITHYIGPLVFANDYITCDVHFAAVPDEEKIVPPPGNVAAVPDLSGPEDLLASALKKMQEGLWEVDATIVAKKTARLRGFLNGTDFDISMDPKDGNTTAMHVIRVKETVYGSLNEGKTWKIEPPDDIVPYNWVHGPIIYKALMPAFEEVEKEQHDGETWLHLRLKVEEEVKDKSELPSYWIALDKDGQPSGVRRYEGFLLSQGKPLQCKMLYKPADEKAAITAPPADKIVNAPAADNATKTVNSSSPKPAGKTVTTRLVDLPGAKLKLELPDEFTLDPPSKKDPQQLAMFSRTDGVWGAVTRGTRGITPERLNGYMNSKVASYTKDLPKEFNVKWLKHEIVTIDGREWADMRYTPTPKGTKTAPKEFKEYANNPLYTRILGTSYQGQLVEVTFTSNLDTEPATKLMIDRIMESLQIQEEK